MVDILSRAGCFVAIILMGFLLRRFGYFKKEDFHVISKIVIRITLTCAIITSFSGRDLDYSMLILTVIGFAYGVLLMVVGYILGRRGGREGKAFGLLNSTGCNIGNFVMPFAQSFLGPVSVMAVSLFDVGNGFICLGGAYAVARMVKEGDGHFSVMPIVRSLCKSVPLITYVVMTILGILRITLPGPVVEFAGIVGNSNAFMAMLMIGVGFNISGGSAQKGTILRILIPRYVIGILFAVLAYLYLPFPVEYRQGLAILFIAPIASAAPAFTANIDGDYGLASAINSMSILISIVLIIVALTLIL